MLTDPEEDYARGFVPFLGQKIFLDSRPLIPRTETEYWVELAIKEIQKSLQDTPRVHHIPILDLFAGSGCIGIAVLAHIPSAHVTFGEKESRHFPTIRKSLSHTLMPGITVWERVSCIETDVWSNISHTYDYIFANPPYVSKERATLMPSVAAHEPQEALYAEDDGFFFIHKTLAGLSNVLTAHGTCYLEHEPFHEKRLKETAAACGFNAETYTDEYGVLRWSRLTRPVA